MWGDTKNQTKPLHCHLATQITMQQPQHPIGWKWPGPLLAPLANHVTGRSNNIEKVVERLSCQPSDMKEGRWVSLVIQLLPRQEGRGNQSCPKQVGTDTKAAVIYCNQNQCHQNFDVPPLPASDQYYGHGLISLYKFRYGKSLPPIFTYSGICTAKKTQKSSIFFIVQAKWGFAMSGYSSTLEYYHTS